MKRVGVLNRILIIYLIIAIPVIAIVTSSNILARVPDMYSYSFIKYEKQIEEVGNASIDTKELSEIFPNYLNGKLEEFQYEAEYQSRYQKNFTLDEQIVMERVKKFLNISVFVDIFLVIGGILACIILRRNRLKKGIDLGLRWSLIAYLVAIGFYGILIFTNFGRVFLRFLLGVPNLNPEWFLSILLSREFFIYWFIATVVISCIILVIIGTIMRKISKERFMFKKMEY